MSPLVENNADWISSDALPPLKAHSNTEYCPLIYEVIPAHGCVFGCRYCNVYSLKEVKTFTPVTVFANYPELLRDTIAEHRKIHGRKVVYYFSPKTDVFQGPLVESGVTERLLRVFVEAEAEFILVTKGRLPNLRVLELLKAAGPRCRVLISAGMKNEQHARVLEPYAAPLEERFALAAACSLQGIPTMGIIEPILPLRDLSFVRQIMERFVGLSTNHFAVDFARISHVCLSELIGSLPELSELTEVYHAPNAVSQVFETGAYDREAVQRFAPSREYLQTKFALLRDYARSLGATISICNYFRVQGINADAYKRGFLCFGIYDPDRAARFLEDDRKHLPVRSCNHV